MEIHSSLQDLLSEKVILIYDNIPNSILRHISSVKTIVLGTILNIPLSVFISTVAGKEVKIVANVHEDCNGMYKNYLEDLPQKYWESIDSVVVPTPLGECMRRFGEFSLHVIPNQIARMFLETPLPQKRFEDELLTLFVGVNPVERHEAYLDACLTFDCNAPLKCSWCLMVGAVSQRNFRN